MQRNILRGGASMSCLECGAYARVLQTRKDEGKNWTYRQRLCTETECQHSWWTVEIPYALIDPNNPDNSEEGFEEGAY
jgi:transcriptional regulator NrdR family protein